MERIFLVIAALAVLGALWNGWRTQRTLDQLEEMLEEVVQGRFSERRFDESRLSRAETQLAHYLSASALSTRPASAATDALSAKSWLIRSASCFKALSLVNFSSLYMFFPPKTSIHLRVP